MPRAQGCTVLLRDCAVLLLGGAGCLHAALHRIAHCPLTSTHASPALLPRRSLRQLLQYEGPGSVEDIFCQSFTVEVPGFGDTRVVPLKDGGADVPVTGAPGGA